MNLIKFFVLLILLTFLAGCASQPCPPPGQPNLSDRICSYKLELVDDPDPDTGRVKAKVPESVLAANIESAKKEGLSRDYSKYPRDTVYSFIVSDTTGLKKGDEVEFHRKPMNKEASYNNSLERGKGTSDPMEKGSGTVK